MNQVNKDQKDQVLKTLAIVGFVAVIIFGVWLAVQIVSLMPQAFSSLASIADGVYNYREAPTEITVVSNTNEVTAGESFKVSWNDMRTDGVYTFSYACTDGVSVKVETETGTTLVPCGETIVVGETKTDTNITVSSERERVSALNYTIAFVESGETESLALDSQTVRVVNPSIPDGDLVASEDNTGESESGELTVAGETTTESEPEVSTPLPPAANPGEPTVIETITFETPVSDPNGRVDLAVRLIAVGHLDSNGNFVQRSNVDNDARGAFQFEVRNVGTKTSDEWDFVADLTSGSEYDAPLQQPLKPQERVTFTLGYDNVGEDGIREIGVTVRGGDDQNSSNNRFTWAVSVVE